MRAPGLLAPLLGLGLGLALSLPPPVATDCTSLGPSERLAFSPAARTRWLAPQVRAPGPLDPLYGMVRRFLSVVQLNPFPSGECAPPLSSPGAPLAAGPQQPPCPWARGGEGRVSSIPTAFFLPEVLGAGYPRKKFQNLLV